MEDDGDEITMNYVHNAIRSSTKTHTMMSAYSSAIHSNQPQNLYRQVLLACAYARKNDGWFRASDVTPALRMIIGKAALHTFARHMEELSANARGNTLTRDGRERRYRYRFRDPLLQPFVKMVLEAAFPLNLPAPDASRPTSLPAPSTGGNP